MLKQLRIQNFKGWKDTGTIRMAPISLFFGANSSGKSSIGQFLMMLKQTVESPDRKGGFLSGRQELGGSAWLLSGNGFSPRSGKQITFDYRWSLPEILKFKDPVTGQSFTGDNLSFPSP